MAISKGALIFLVFVAIFAVLAAIGFCFFHSQTLGWQKCGFWTRSTQDVEMRELTSLEPLPDTPLPRSKSDSGPQAKQPSVGRVPLPRTQSDGASVGLARAPVAYLPKWSRTPRPVVRAVPAKRETIKALKRKPVRDSRFVEHL